MAVMPDVVGRNLQDATAMLQVAGVIVPASLTYFSTWPISVDWIKNPFPVGFSLTADNTPITADTTLVTADESFWTLVSGEIVNQSVTAGATIAANAPLVLEVVQYAVGVAYP